MNMTHNQLSQD